jgi:hypothetical protein
MDTHQSVNWTVRDASRHVRAAKTSKITEMYKELESLSTAN